MHIYKNYVKRRVSMGNRIVSINNTLQAHASAKAQTHRIKQEIDEWYDHMITFH